MGIVNIIVVAVLLLCIIKGYQVGFAQKLLSICSFFVSGICAWIISGMLDQLLQMVPHIENETVDLLFYNVYKRLVIFLVLFVLLIFALMLLRPVARLFNHIPVVSFCNRFAGSILGFVQGMLLLLLATLILELPFFADKAALVQNSWLRHTTEFADMLLFYTRYPIQELAKLKDVLEHKESFTQEEAQRIKAWLQEQNIEKDKLEQIMDMLKVETV